jgi:putative nucleotidyltransferase with HDIG domain
MKAFSGSSGILYLGLRFATLTGTQEIRGQMNSVGRQRKAFVTKMGTVTIDMDEYVRAGADIDVLRMVIDKIEDLPPLPLIVHKILSLTQDEKTNTSALAKVISNDQALTAKVLKIANSPLYRVSSVVTSISHAVALLGFRAIRDLALGFSTIDSFIEFEENQFFPRQRFWEHSLACAHCCKAVADRIRHRFPDEAFVGGLLHDIGRMVFNQSFPVSFNHAVTQAQLKRRPLLDLEREEIGIPHTLVGKLLLKKWNLPPALGDAVQFHHRPRLNSTVDPSKADISLIIMIADTLTKLACIGFGGEGHIHPTDGEVWRAIGLEEEDYVRVLKGLSENVQEIKGFFGMKDGSAPSDGPAATGEENELRRLAFYAISPGDAFIPMRAMLRQFFQVKSFPTTGDIRTGIEQTGPHMVFVDLSSEARAD